MYDKFSELNLEHNDKIIILSNGEFYYVFNENAYIVHYFFKYKILQTRKYNYISFPKRSLRKVLKILNSYCIGYVLFDGTIIDISYGDSLVYQDILLKYLDNKYKQDLIDNICNILNNKSIDELRDIYNDIN